MQLLTPAGENLVNDLSSRYNLNRDTVVHMLVAVNNGGGSMAQFSCPELGGSGQWMRGGMTMVGDMFNHGLKMTVDNLCNELANGLVNAQIFPVIPAGSPGSNQWWPADCGSPISSGAQNNTRYAVFPGKLAVQLNGQVTVYDTLNHNIGGVSQQQGGDNSLTFSSQFGTISVSQLPVLSSADNSGSGMAAPEAANTNFLQPPVPELEPQPEPQLAHQVAHQVEPQQAGPQVVPQTMQPQLEQQGGQWANSGTAAASTDEIISLIEKLATLRDAGALTGEDFDTKKKELLARL